MVVTVGVGWSFYACRFFSGGGGFHGVTKTIMTSVILLCLLMRFFIFLTRGGEGVEMENAAMSGWGGGRGAYALVRERGSFHAQILSWDGSSRTCRPACVMRTMLGRASGDALATLWVRLLGLCWPWYAPFSIHFHF
jgi:hypothetical protein